MIDRRAFIASLVALVVAPNLPATPLVAADESTLDYLLREWQRVYGCVLDDGGRAYRRHIRTLLEWRPQDAHTERIVLRMITATHAESDKGSRFSREKPT